MARGSEQWRVLDRLTLSCLIVLSMGACSTPVVQSAKIGAGGVASSARAEPGPPTAVTSTSAVVTATPTDGNPATATSSPVESSVTTAPAAPVPDSLVANTPATSATESPSATSTRTPSSVRTTPAPTTAKTAAVPTPKATAAPPTSTPTPSPAAKSAPSPSPSAAPPAPSSGADAYEAEVLRLVNQERANAGLAPLTAQGCPDGFAEPWSVQLAQQGSLSHQSLTPLLSRCGAKTAGENVGYNSSPSAATMVAAFMASPPHRANILRDTFTGIGIGAYRDGNGVWWVTQDFVG